VPEALTWVASTVAVWLVAGAVLAWARLPGRWRRRMALLASLAGLAFLIAAVNSEGIHEASATGVFLIGAPYVTAQASALTSLPYYILTGLCLLLGTAALGVRDDVAHSLARRWMATALGLSFLVSLTRFAMEKVAAPAALTQLFGVIWLAPIVGAYFFVALRSEGRGWGALVAALVVYGLATRAFVMALYVIATMLHLGSHHDLSTVWAVRAPWGPAYHFVPGSFSQMFLLVLVPQLFFWPAFTVATGALGAGVVHLIQEARKPPSPEPPRVDVRLATNAEP
jgi:hypothetical protein